MNGNEEPAIGCPGLRPAKTVESPANRWNGCEPSAALDNVNSLATYMDSQYYDRAEQILHRVTLLRDSL